MLARGDAEAQPTLSQARTRVVTPPSAHRRSLGEDTTALTATGSSYDERLGRVTLKQRVNQEPTVPSAPPASQKRLMDLHVTGFPNSINRDLLPDRAKGITDFTELDPTRYRKNHIVKDENASTLDAASLADQKAASGLNGREESMMTTSQVAARLSAMGVQIRQAHERERMMNSSESAASLRAKAIPRGYQSKNYAPAYDVRSSYRLAYDKDEDGSNQDGARRSHLVQYRDGWTDAQKADVDASMKQPFLTQPVSALQDDRFRTVYRAGMIPEAGELDFRTMSYKSNLPELGTTFAYSAYAYDDARRDIPYNPAIASLKNPHSVVEGARALPPSVGSLAGGATKSFSGSARGGSRTRDELERVRELRRQTLMRSSASRRQKPETVEDLVAANQRGSIVLPGTRGCGYRRAPGDRDDYIFLPRDTFSQRPIDDI